MLVALDCATDTGSIALGEGAGLLGEVTIGVHTRHAEALLPALDFLLRSTHVERSDIRGVVVGAGPGSFTGVRIAAATARGLAQGLEVPLYAYSTLAALALDVHSHQPVCTLLDARRGEVYGALYRAAGDRLEELLEPMAVPLRDLLRRVAPYEPVFAGSGAVRYADALPVEPVRATVRAEALLRLAAADPDAGRIDRLAGWEPTYLRSSGAERGVAG